MSSVIDRAALLQLDHVSYTYLDRFRAVDDVSLEVLAGERLALLGANGCGKSTLLKILDALVVPDTRTFRAFGVELTSDSLEDEQMAAAFRARIGFVFQNSDAQVFSPTVREEVAFGPLNMGLDSAEATERVDQVLAMLEIRDLGDRAPYQLSGGQKKRVAIASVLVMNPEVLLFDEPTAALDPRTQGWLTELILELAASGKTIVLATHDLDRLEILADRCVVLSEDHCVVRVCTPSELLDDHDLLVQVNLAHEHTHAHGRLAHNHLHGRDHHPGFRPPAGGIGRRAPRDG